MIKMIAAVARRAGMTHAECVAYHQQGSLEAPFEGVGCLWFDDASTIGAFRAYEAALLHFNAQAHQAFYVPAKSFFVYAREVLIL